MKQVLYFLLLMFIFSSCDKSPKLIDISFIQNGKRIQPIDGTITLDKAPFDMIFKASKPFDVMVNASFNDSIFKLAQNTKALTEQEQFKETAGIAEVLFNADEGMYISKDATSIWYYEDEKSHKFNTVEIENESYNCIRSIKNLHDSDTDEHIDITQINRPIYLVLLSVDKIDGSVRHLKELQRLAVKIEWKTNTSSLDEKPKTTPFKSIISDLRTRNLPLIDSTNFDAIIEEPYFFNSQEVDLLQLKQIYPNYDKDGYNYRTTPSYKVELSKDYYSAVFTSYKGDHEMESVLVNYGFDGLLIDYMIISYDEVAEGFIRTTSKIEEQSVTKTTVTWIEDKEEDTQRFQIDNHGIISEISLNDLTDIALEYLNVDENDVLFDFFSLIEISEIKTLIFVPKVSEDSDNQLIIDANLLLINPKTGEILSEFIEQNSWYSDAIQITSIEVNYNPYRITEHSETVGITVEYYGASRVNPYASKIFTLFNRRGDVLERVLQDYEIHNLTGENDGDGNGFYNENSKTITSIVSSETEYYNLKIIDSIKEVTYKNRTDKTINTSVNSERLHYQNGMYLRDTIH
jgi:hypothetical protein